MASMRNNKQSIRRRRPPIRLRWSDPILLFIFSSVLAEISWNAGETSIVTAFQSPPLISRVTYAPVNSRFLLRKENSNHALFLDKRSGRCSATRLLDSEVSEAEIEIPAHMTPVNQQGNSVNGARSSNGVTFHRDLNVNFTQPELTKPTATIDKSTLITTHHAPLTHNESVVDCDIPIPTENGGYTHTTASRAKISAANKGKIPWNKGKNRSEEVRARIAAGVRAKNREKFLAKLEEMGMTEEEFEEQKKAERKQKDAERRARKTEKGGYRPTTETKQKISDILKAKWANGEMSKRNVDPSKVRRGFQHSEETRAKISASLRERWANDENYREKMVNKTTAVNTGESARRKISETLKAKWQEPEYREKMLGKIKNRTSSKERNPDYRRKISESMKAKWQETEYRAKTTASIRKHAAELTSKRPPKPTVPKPRRSPKDGLKSSSIRLATVAAPRKPPLPRKKPLEVKDEAESMIMETKPTTTVKKIKKVAKKTVKKKTVKKATTVLANGETTKKESKPTKEPDGSINRLKDERRDLYDLLYGDEEAYANRKPVSTGIAALLDLEDENLDTFDPYGLEDH